MTTADGRTIHRSEQTFTISNGEISLDLEPNETATPAGTACLVIYRPKAGQACWSERWVVPVSEIPVNQVCAPASYLAVLPD